MPLSTRARSVSKEDSRSDDGRTATLESNDKTPERRKNQTKLYEYVACV
jgi:hypothetical protein